MIDFLDSDLRAIMADSAFSERFTFTPVTPEGAESRGEPQEAAGVFNRPLREPSALSSSGPAQIKSQIASRDISVTVAASALGAWPRKEDLVEQGGKKYKVRRVLSDGQGLVTLGLWKTE
jgi:hypothetical protein